MWVQDYEKYAFVLRNALEKGEITLSKRIKYEYDPLWAIRAVIREDTDFSTLTEDDFYSQEEKRYYGRKMPRGVSYEFSNDLGKYSCSFFKSKEEIGNALHLPRKGWKLAVGKIIDSYGSIMHRETKPHIHFFRYDKVVPAFQIINYHELDAK